MYIGVDFLIDKKLNLYLTEVNTGLPGGAHEYDLVHKVKYGKSSDVFAKIENISKRIYSKSFSSYIRKLSFFKELRQLKIWMDGMGKLPDTFPHELRVEDKWIQYNILSKKYPVIKTALYDPNDIEDYSDFFRNNKAILKRRFGRGGRGFRIFDNISDLKKCNIEKEAYIIQPFINSSIGPYRLSIRVAAFSGYYVCMYANLSKRITSNHGFLSFVRPGKKIMITDETFKTVKFNCKAWEADIFYGKNIPDYLYHNLYEEEVAIAELVIPEKIYLDIINISREISKLYDNINYSSLQKSYIEKTNDNKK